MNVVQDLSDQSLKLPSNKLVEKHVLNEQFKQGEEEGYCLLEEDDKYTMERKKLVKILPEGKVAKQAKTGSLVDRKKSMTPIKI